MSFVLQVDYYAGGERVLSLAPGLVILVSDRDEPADSSELGERCGKCGRALRSWPLDPALQSELYSLVGRPPFQYLGCDCLVVVFASHLARRDIIARWKEFRRLQNRVLAWTVHN